MKKLVELRNDYLTEIETILATAEQEGRVLTEKEIARLKELKAETEKVDANMKAVEEARALTIVEEKEEKLTEEMEKREMDKTMEIREMEEKFVNAVRTGEIRELSTANGQALIPTTVADRIISRVIELSPLLQESTIYRTAGDLRIVKENQGMVCDFVEEGQVIAPKEMTFDAVVLKSYIIAGLTLVTNQMINNTNVDIVGYIVERVALAVKEKIEDAMLNGTEKGKGIVTTNNILEVSPAELMTIDTFIDAQAKCKAPAGECIWVVNREQLAEMRKMKTSTGELYLINDVVNSFQPMLLGSRVTVSDKAVNISYLKPQALAVKFSQDITVNVLKERYADMLSTGVIASAEFDCAVANDEQVVVVKTTPARKK